MESKEIIEILMRKDSFIAVKNIDEMILPKKTGLYCIRVIDINNSGFKGEIEELFNKRNSKILYIGKSDRSTLKERLLQELRAKKHGTFFRSLGSVLGYLPPKGSLKNRKNKQNYKFNQLDELAIINWINKHLEVSWIETSKDISNIEKYLINLYTPFLNLKDNPNSLPLLKDIRKRCREFADS